MKKALLGIIFVLVAGCGTSIKYVPFREAVTIPAPPKVVVMDNGKYDKSKYPNTAWVKEPTADLKNGRAYWSFDDTEKISNGLTEWPKWGQEVEKIIDIYNQGAKDSGKQGDTKKKSPWYRFWE